MGCAKSRRSSRGGRRGIYEKGDLCNGAAGATAREGNLKNDTAATGLRTATTLLFHLPLVVLPVHRYRRFRHAPRAVQAQDWNAPAIILLDRSSFHGIQQIEYPTYLLRERSEVIRGAFHIYNPKGAVFYAN